MDKGKEVYYQGSRQIDNVSRRYYERELGAGYAPGPSGEGFFGYTEPVRRFIQREDFSPQANEIPNTMPSWVPGDDYLTNFRVGDPFAKIDQGYARLPGAGYEALHPELKGVNPEDYPDIYKLSILADVAPYSREYNIFRQKVGSSIGDNTEMRIEYEKILERVRQTRSLRLAGNKNSRARAPESRRPFIVSHTVPRSAQPAGWSAFTCSAALTVCILPSVPQVRWEAFSILVQCSALSMALFLLTDCRMKE